MTATPQSRPFIQLHQFTTLKKPQNNVSFDLIPMSTVIKITPFPWLFLASQCVIQFRFYWPIATTGVITMHLCKFLTLDGFPISRKCFADNCSLAIRYCGLDPSRYKGYSFRIGAASWITDQSLSHTQIRLLVCWNPNVFQKHIGVSSLSSVYLVYSMAITFPSS